MHKVPSTSFWLKLSGPFNSLTSRSSMYSSVDISSVILTGAGQALFNLSLHVPLFNGQWQLFALIKDQIGVFPGVGGSRQVQLAIPPQRAGTSGREPIVKQTSLQHGLFLSDRLQRNFSCRNASCWTRPINSLARMSGFLQAILDLAVRESHRQRCTPKDPRDQ